jgi:CBS domain containing-hemolysin-like protein
MTGSWLAVLAALGLVALNGFFVATEFALVKVRPTRLDELARRGSGAARRTLRLVERLDEYLSATQLGITLASLALGWIGEPAFAHLIEPLATRAGFSAGTTEALAAAFSFLLITFLHIVFGELAPKSLAIQRAEGTALAVSTPMLGFRMLFYPAIWALNGLANAALRLVGLGSAQESSAVHTEDELRLIVTEMRTRQRGSRPLEVVDRTLRFPQRAARDLMVARGDIVYFRLEQSPEERREVARRAGHSRYPVIEEDLDHVLGIFNVRDVFHAGVEPRTPEELRAMLRPPLYVPETMSADSLLREFRRSRQQLAIVVDEYGGTAGLVTVADLIGAIVGEMDDEFSSRDAPWIAALPGGRYRIDPRTSVADFAHHFGVTVEPGSAATVGGLVIEKLRRIPAVGDKVAVGPLTLQVDEMDGPRIAALSATRAGGD